SIIISVMFAVIVVLIYNSNQKINSMQIKQNNEFYRKLGNKLKSEKMFTQAIQAYKNYLRNPALDSFTQANINYIIGDLYFETNNYEKAIAAYYSADILGASKQIQSDLNIKIVNCLERLGRDFSAEYALKSRSSLDEDKTAETKEGKVIARYGSETITLRDLDEQIEQLDEKTRQVYRSPQKKFEFLQQYLSTKLLARKAKKMGYGRDTEINKKLNMLKDQLMIQKMAQAQFNKKIKPTTEDIKLYYEANKEKYNIPEQVKIAHILFDSRDKAEEALKKIKNGADFTKTAQELSLEKSTKNKGGAIDQWLSAQNPNALGVDRTHLINAALETKKGGVTDVIQDPQGFHIVKVIDKKPAQEKTFPEVAQQAAQDYQVFKAQLVYRDMMENILKVEGVQIYKDVLFGEQKNNQDK
ncbi:peptidyl-prolyl cis-trans isomerase, partial [bacterium]|nr:peptidyl-prolyl cis-trans isomerase [bacterium]